MTTTQLTENFHKDKITIQNNNRLSQVEKDVAIFRKWRIYINEHSTISNKYQEDASIVLTIKK